MGNQLIKNELKQVMDPEFNDAELEPYAARLWSFDELESFFGNG